MRGRWDFLERSGQSVDTALLMAPVEDGGLPAWVEARMRERGLTKADVVRRSRLNQTFAYQILAGTRHAKRDKLIQLAFGMGLRLVETCDLLERGGTNMLMPTVRRDVIIAFALYQGLGLSACDDLLWEHRERTLVSGDTPR